MHAVDEVPPFWLFDPTEPSKRTRASLVLEDGRLRIQAYNIPGSRPAFLAKEIVPVLYGDGHVNMTIFDALNTGGIFKEFGEEASIIPGMILLGAHVPSGTATFESVHCTLPDLHAWFQTTGFSFDPERVQPGTISVSYEKPPIMEWKLTNGFTVTYGVHLTKRLQRLPRSSVELIQKNELSTYPSSPLPLKELLRYSQKIESFFELARDDTADLDRIEVGYSIDGNTERLTAMAELTHGKRDNGPSYLHCFEFVEVKDGMAEHLSRWCDLYDELPLTLDFYRSSKRAAGLNVEFRFFSIVSALESLHRTFFDPTDEKKCEKCKRPFPMNLEQRLKDLVARFGHWTRELLREDQCALIAATRNYLAHQIPKLKSKSIPGNDLYLYYRRLTMVFEICLMAQLGFSSEQMDRFVIRRWNVISHGMLGDWGL